MRRSYGIVIGALLVVVIVLIASCAVLLFSDTDFGQNSWLQYESGGLFLTDSPAIDLAGQRIIYASQATGKGDIRVLDLDTGVTRPTVATSVYEASPRFADTADRFFFVREEVPFRHVWLKDVKTGKESQITVGAVVDDILDVSSSGEHILIGRRDATSRGVSLCYNVSVATKSSVAVNLVTARFVGGGQELLGTRMANGPKVVRTDVKGNVRDVVARGWVYDVNDISGLSILIGRMAEEGEVNKELLCMTNGQTVVIGDGHSPCAFRNGKVLYFKDRNFRPFVWNRETLESKSIGEPIGYAIRPLPAHSNDRVPLFVLRPGERRVYDIYLFDSMTESLVSLKPVD